MYAYMNGRQGFRVTGSVCDVASRAQREELISTISSLFNGKLNILINNVGTNMPKQTIEYTAEDFSFLMCTNLESAYHTCQLAYPLLKASEAGSIVFVSSVAGVVGLTPGVSIYAAAKVRARTGYVYLMPFLQMDQGESHLQLE
nr:isoform 2 of senescence-associated protein 13 [Quercus suber]